MQTKSLLVIVSSGIRQEANLEAGLDLIFVLAQSNPTCTPPKNPILFTFFPS